MLDSLKHNDVSERITPDASNSNVDLFSQIYDRKASAEQPPGKTVEPTFLEIPTKIAGWTDNPLGAAIQNAVDAQVKYFEPVVDIFTNATQSEQQEEPAQQPTFLDQATSVWNEKIEPVLNRVQTNINKTIIEPAVSVGDVIGNSIQRAVDPILAPTSKNTEQQQPTQVVEASAAALLPAVPLLVESGITLKSALSGAAVVFGEIGPGLAGVVAFEGMRRYGNPAIGNLTDEQIEERDNAIKADAENAMRTNFKGYAALKDQEGGKPHSAESSVLATNRDSVNTALTKAARGGIESLKNLGAALDSAQTNTSDIIRTYLNGFNPADLLLTNGNSKLDSNLAPKPIENFVTPFDPSQSTFELKTPQKDSLSDTERDSNINKKPGNNNENNQDAIFDSRKERRTPLDHIIGASVGIGDNHDGKPLPIGVNPDRILKPGDQPNPIKIGDEPPEKPVPTFLPVFPDRRDVHVITNKITPFKVDHDGNNKLPYDTTPPEIGLDPTNKPFILPDKVTRPFGDNFSASPEVIQSILNGASRFQMSDNGSSDPNEAQKQLTFEFLKKSLEQVVDKKPSELDLLLAEHSSASVEVKEPLSDLTFPKVPSASLGVSSDTPSSIVKQDKYDDSLNYLRNNHYDANDIAKNISNHPLFRQMYETFTAEEKEELERHGVGRPKSSKDSPIFKIENSANSIMMSGNSSPESSDSSEWEKIKDKFPGAINYSSEKAFPWSPKELIVYGEDGNRIGSISEKELLAHSQTGDKSESRQDEKNAVNDGTLSLDGAVKLAQSGMEGEIWRRPDGNYVKVTDKESALAEIAHLKLLKEAGIPTVEILEQGSINDRPGKYAYAMPDGGQKLSEWLKDKPSEQSLKDVMVELNEINYKLRNNNLEHGDYGAHNILIDNQGKLTVIHSKPTNGKSDEESMNILEESIILEIQTRRAENVWNIFRKRG